MINVEEHFLTKQALANQGVSVDTVLIYSGWGDLRYFPGVLPGTWERATASDTTHTQYTISIKARLYVITTGLISLAQATLL